MYHLMLPLSEEFKGLANEEGEEISAFDPEPVEADEVDEVSEDEELEGGRLKKSRNRLAANIRG